MPLSGPLRSLSWTLAVLELAGQGHQLGSATGQAECAELVLLTLAVRLHDLLTLAMADFAGELELVAGLLAASCLCTRGRSPAQTSRSLVPRWLPAPSEAGGHRYTYVPNVPEAAIPALTWEIRLTTLDNQRADRPCLGVRRRLSLVRTATRAFSATWMRRLPRRAPDSE